MSGGIVIEMTRSARRANVMNVFADEKEQCVTTRDRNCHGPPWSYAQTFRQNREKGHAKERPSRETDESAKLLVLQLQRRADPSANQRKTVSRNDLPERINHSGVCDRRVVLAAKVRLDRDVDQLLVPT